MRYGRTNVQGVLAYSIVKNLGNEGFNDEFSSHRMDTWNENQTCIGTPYPH
jgi:hypothetical protein